MNCFLVSTGGFFIPRAISFPISASCFKQKFVETHANEIFYLERILEIGYMLFPVRIHF